MDCVAYLYCLCLCYMLCVMKDSKYELTDEEEEEDEEDEDDMLLAYDDEDDEEGGDSLSEEELQEAFSELSNGKDTITVRKLKSWDEVQGWLQDELIQESGTRHTLYIHYQSAVTLSAGRLTS